MSIFWLLVAAMIAVALLFIVPPVLRSKSLKAIDHDQIATQVIKEQLGELEADLDAGKLDKTAYTAARHDLERALLDDLSKTEPVDISERSGRWASSLLALAVPAAALFIYHQLGSQSALSTHPQAVAASTTNDTGHSLDAMISQLATRLQENPDDIEGWIMLASSYASTDQYAKAATAYKEVIDRTGGNHPQLLTDYADTLAMSNGGDFTDKVGDLLQTALKLEPDNIKALWLMGHWHSQRSQYDASLKHWKQAYALLPVESKNAAALKQQILIAQNSSGAKTTEMPVTQKKPQSATAASIQVSVSLDPALQEKASPEDTLFIFARAVKGPRMPLAIVKKQVKDLPVTVTLDDSQAMSPQMVLSRFPDVSIGARISKT
ncbi:MAG: c-type cytochrome biogenesis protein CcmI, partial [Gammaproteobacteria bacterium]